jgi:hypothetical protein
MRGINQSKSINIMAIATQNAKPESVKTQALSTYTMPDKPVFDEAGKAGKGMVVIPKGTATGRKDKSGNPTFTKGLTIRAPKVSETGLQGEEAQQAIITAGKSIKPAIMGRVAAFSNQEAVIVRRYSETPGKRNKMSLTLEQVSVETTISKLAREYGMTEEEVRKRLNIPEKGTELGA